MILITTNIPLSKLPKMLAKLITIRNLFIHPIRKYVMNISSGKMRVLKVLTKCETISSVSCVLPKGRSFTANSGTKAAILPKGRSYIANSGT